MTFVKPWACELGRVEATLNTVSYAEMDCYYLYLCWDELLDICGKKTCITFSFVCIPCNCIRLGAVTRDRCWSVSPLVWLFVLLPVRSLSRICNGFCTWNKMNYKHNMELYSLYFSEDARKSCLCTENKMKIYLFMFLLFLFLLLTA